MNKLISIGESFPSYSKKAVVSVDSTDFPTLTSESLVNSEGRWTCMFWWPKDFTFVCPTEIVAFNDAFDEFKKRNCDLIGASTDSEFVHLAWRQSHEGLKGLKFPMLADTSKGLAKKLGILTKGEKIAYRATFIIDPTGKVRWVCVNDLAVGRSVEEVLRVFDALQTGELCPANWKKGEKTL